MSDVDRLPAQHHGEGPFTMSTSRRIATIAALPVALGIAFAAPAVASAAPVTTDAATTTQTSDRDHDGLYLGGLLNLGGGHHGHGHHNGLNLGLSLSLHLVLGGGWHCHC
jgi:hypothetical protein